MNPIKRKRKMHVYALPPKAEEIHMYAEELGFSESAYFIYLHNYWLENCRHNPNKVKGDITKALMNRQS